MVDLRGVASILAESQVCQNVQHWVPVTWTTLWSTAFWARSTVSG